MATPRSRRQILAPQENIVSRDACADDDKKPHVQPKAPRSAFMCFTDEKRKEIMEQNPNQMPKSSEVLNIVAKQWRKLSPRERAYWDEAARNDKVRFVREKAEYRGVFVVPKKRAKKHPDAPKRPMSAFLKFSQTRRNMVKTANPNIENTDVSRLLGEMWRNASPAEKQPYIEQEQRERAEYKVMRKKWDEDQAKQSATKSTGHRVRKTLDQPSESNGESYSVSHRPDSRHFQSFRIQSVEEAVQKVDERMNYQGGYFRSSQKPSTTEPSTRRPGRDVDPTERHFEPLSCTYSEGEQEHYLGSYYSHSPANTATPDKYGYYYGYGSPSQGPYDPRVSTGMKPSGYHGEQNYQYGRFHFS